MYCIKLKCRCKENRSRQKKDSRQPASASIMGELSNMNMRQCKCIIKTVKLLVEIFKMVKRYLCYLWIIPFRSWKIPRVTKNVLLSYYEVNYYNILFVIILEKLHNPSFHYLWLTPRLVDKKFNFTLIHRETRECLKA